MKPRHHHIKNSHSSKKSVHDRKTNGCQRRGPSEAGHTAASPSMTKSPDPSEQKVESSTKAEGILKIVQEIRSQLATDVKNLTVLDARLWLIEDFIKLWGSGVADKKSLQRGLVTTAGGWLIV